MALQILLNVLIAVTWMFMSSSFTASTFTIGYLLGLFMIILMGRFFRERLYIWRLWAALKLLLLFIKELAMSNFDMLKVVLSPKLDIQPIIFALPTELEHDWEITLLSMLITLTPGTVVLNVSEDQKTLYIHAIDSDDVDESIRSIKDTFEKAILEVSRP